MVVGSDGPGRGARGGSLVCEEGIRFFGFLGGGGKDLGSLLGTWGGFFVV